METKKQLELYRELGRKFGKMGGRPRTIPHSDEPGCGCRDCRVKKQAKMGKKERGK